MDQYWDAVQATSPFDQHTGGLLGSLSAFPNIHLEQQGCTRSRATREFGHPVLVRRLNPSPPVEYYTHAQPSQMQSYNQWERFVSIYISLPPPSSRASRPGSMRSTPVNSRLGHSRLASNSRRVFIMWQPQGTPPSLEVSAGFDSANPEPSGNLAGFLRVS